MSIVPSVKYVKIGGSMVAKPISLRKAGAWSLIQSVPGAPTAVQASAGSSQAILSWAAPANTGGIPITGYTVTASPGGATATTSTASATVTGLSNGTAYTFTVRATNAVGNSVASTASNAVTPITVTGRMYLVAASGNYNVGDTVTVVIHEDSLTTTTGAVESDLLFSPTLLQYVSTTVNSAVFTAGFPVTTSSGSVHIPAGISTGSVSGDQTVATVTFTALAAGAAAITLDTGSCILRDSDAANVLNSSIGATYTIS